MDQLSYLEAGVDIQAGNDLVSKIKPLATSTQNKNVLTALGGFAGLYELPKGYTNPVLLAATDGVGTKLKIANLLNKHDTIGIDLVAMCANDILVAGGKPLFFLDYYATSKLDINIATDVITGITQACKELDISLLGGETAEMPGLYKNKDYDLAGFCVGIAEKDNLINHNNVKENNVIIGLSSSGPHSNGFSLVRKVLEKKLENSNNVSLLETSLLNQLLTPTVLYINPLYNLINNKLINSCAHITGGGLIENTARVIPDNLSAIFDLKDYQFPEIFSYLQKEGNITTQEMYKVFNCGIGMILICAESDCDQVLDCYNNYEFNQYNQTSAFKIGKIVKKSDAKLTNNQAVVLKFQ